MDFGIMDTSTCKPMEDALLEIWHGKLPLLPQTLTISDLPSFISELDWHVRWIRLRNFPSLGDLASWWLAQ